MYKTCMLKITKCWCKKSKKAEINEETYCVHALEDPIQQICQSSPNWYIVLVKFLSNSQQDFFIDRAMLSPKFM